MDYSVPAVSTGSSGLSFLWPLLIIVAIIVVIMIVYHQTVGYYINYGWTNLWNLINKKEEVDVTVNSGDTPLVNAKFKQFDEKKENAVDRLQEELLKQSLQAPPPPPPVEVHHITPPQQPFFPNSAPTVYNVSNNDYTFYDAPAVCKAFNGELATYEQVKEAYDNGADWCNYGWIQGQQAVYPTQKSTWEKLQKGKPEFAKSCGKPGVNGGRFDNPELRFGVNCFGPRPPKKALDEDIESQVALPPSTEEIEFDKKVQRYRDNITKIGISPFRHSKD